MYLVSACLAGFNTRYDGSSCLDERVKRLVVEGRALPVCPEQRLGTPRTPVEFAGGDGRALLEGKATVLGRDGKDYTRSFIKGAEEVLRVAALYGIKEAILKDGSPSCGVTYVHSKSGKIKGRGVAARMLEMKGIKVMAVDSL